MTTYKAISTEKGNIETLYSKTIADLERRIKKTCFSYKIIEA